MAGQQAHRTIHAGGEWLEAVSGATREILDPADAKPFAVVAEGDERDADAAVAAARRAFDEGTWARTPVAERAALLRRVAGSLVRDRESLGRLESRDTGKTPEEGCAGIDCVADAFRYFADLVVGGARHPRVVGTGHGRVRAFPAARDSVRAAAGRRGPTAGRPTPLRSGYAPSTARS